MGDGTFQPESGQATFAATDTTTGATTTFTQNKRMYYYSGSVLPIEWTSQHGCGGNSKVSCEIILQYACEDTLDPQVDNFWPWVADKAEASTAFFGKQHFRDTDSTPQNIAAPRDGVPRDSNDAATDTIQDNAASATPNTVETRRFGMHESYDYYQLCQRTERNKGLYTADQIVQRNDRRGTRQNPNGDRHGFECPEERDYYPWWAPSPWIDIAVLTDSGADLPCYPQAVAGCTLRCQYYMNNTMNSHQKVPPSPPLSPLHPLLLGIPSNRLPSPPPNLHTPSPSHRQGYCDVDHAAAGATVQKKLNDAKWKQNQWYNNRKVCAAAKLPFCHHNT